MKTYTIEEKENLLRAIDFYLLTHGRPDIPRMIETEIGILTTKPAPFIEIRAKLILDIESIMVEKLHKANVDSTICCLCGEHFHLNYPEQAIIIGYGDVCDNCFKKYKPELYKETIDSNEAFQVKMEGYAICNSKHN
jgi:hypothetical protein